MDQMDYISMSSTLPTPLPPPSISLVALNILTALNPKTKDIQVFKGKIPFQFNFLDCYDFFNSSLL